MKIYILQPRLQKMAHEKLWMVLKYNNDNYCAIEGGREGNGRETLF